MPERDHHPRRPSLDEQARALGTPPIASEDTCALDGVWESDAEVEEFIGFVRGERQRDVA